MGGMEGEERKDVARVLYRNRNNPTCHWPCRQPE